MIKRITSIFTSFCVIILMLNVATFLAPVVSADEISGFTNGNIYNIKNAGSGKYLNVHYGIDANGTNIYQWTKDGSTEQKFKIEYVSSTDSYRIRAMCSSNGTNRMLYMNGTVASGVNVHLWTLDAYSLTEWKFIYVSAGKYKIVARADNNIALTSYGTSNGTASGKSSTSAGNVFISTYTGSNNQLWYLELLNPSRTVSDGVYYLKNKYSGYYMDAANAGGSGANVSQWSFHGGKNQQWVVTYLDSGYYSIEPWYDHYGLSLDVQGAYDTNGAEVQIYTNHGGASEQFRIIDNGDGSYRISPRCTYDSKVVEVGGSYKDNVGGNVNTWTYVGSENQKWFLENYKETQNSDLNANSEYNRTNAKNYAVQHAENVNSYYPEFTDSNGTPEDCTNFASQCLNAGGLSPVGAVVISDRGNYNNWFYGVPYNGTGTSYSWSGAPLFAKHWGTNNGSGRQRAQLTIEFISPDAVLKNWYYFYNNVYNGDIIQIADTKTGSPYHTMVVQSDNEWNNTYNVPDIYYAQHTDNKLNCSLYSRLSLEASVNNQSEWTILVHRICW